MSFNKFAAVAASGLLMFGAAQLSHAEELLVTSVAKAKGSVFSVDVMTEGAAVALQFNIALPKGVLPEQVDLSKCVADLPKSHKGQCSVAKGQIIGIVYNDQNVALPAGVVSIGKIGLNNGAAKSAKLSVAYFEVNDASARELPVSSRVSQEK